MSLRPSQALNSAPLQLVVRLQPHCSASSSSPALRGRLQAPLRRPVPAQLQAAAPRRGGHWAHGRRCLHVAASGGPYTPYPWDEQEYYRVGLQMVQTSGPLGSGVQQGYFLLMRVDEAGAVEDSERTLVMSVGGDTLSGVAQLAQGLSTGAAGGRPLSLDLLWQVLQRGQEISKRTWGVLRVGVVELRGNTFVGRVFFGDPATGTVAWDCDCRPSDACWLALKSKSPIFVHRLVWEDCAMLLRDIQRGAEERQAYAARAERESRNAAQLEAEAVPATELTPTAIMTTPRTVDPEPLKRLKMEMRVALHEEDYTAAARIRDHPWMRLHLSGMQALQAGDLEEAERCERQLKADISEHEEAEERQQRHHDAGSSGGGGAAGGGELGGPGRQFY